MDVDFQKSTPAKATGGGRSNGKTPSSSAKANGSSRKKDDVKAKILACAKTGGDIFVIPMPNLAQRASMGGDDVTPIKLELTLPVAVAEEVMRASHPPTLQPSRDGFPSFLIPYSLIPFSFPSSPQPGHFWICLVRRVFSCLRFAPDFYESVNESTTGFRVICYLSLLETY